MKRPFIHITGSLSQIFMIYFWSLPSTPYWLKISRCHCVWCSIFVRCLTSLEFFSQGSSPVYFAAVNYICVTFIVPILDIKCSMNVYQICRDILIFAASEICLFHCITHTTNKSKFKLLEGLFMRPTSESGEFLFWAFEKIPDGIAVFSLLENFLKLYKDFPIIEMLCWMATHISEFSCSGLSVS